MNSSGGGGGASSYSLSAYKKQASVSRKKPPSSARYDPKTGKPMTLPDVLTLQVQSSRILGLRLFVIRELDGKPVSGSVKICARAFKQLEAVSGAQLIPIKLQSGWPKEDTWSFPIESHDAAVEALKDCRLPVEPVHAHVLGLLLRPKMAPSPDDTIRERIGDKLWNRLMPFQKDGVRFGTSRNGCCLIGDEMGLGKTLQGLSLATFYSRDWPLLVVCPSSLRQNWYNNILEHSIGLGSSSSSTNNNNDDGGGGENDDDIHIIKKGKDELRGRVVIMSYALLQQKDLFGRILSYGFKTMLLDECHYIKTESAKRSKQVIRLAARMKHRILLSGTPMSRSQEIFNQIKAVDPTIFPEFFPYGNGRNPWNPGHFFFSVRYCDPQKQYRGFKQYVWKHGGNARSTELFAVLERLVMIRRRKKEVLTDLPPKVRERVVVEELRGKALLKFQTELERVAELRTDEGSLVGDPAFMELVRQTAAVKVKLIANYLREVMWGFLEGNPGTKFIVFGHHKMMLNAIQAEAEQANIGFIRIDGGTPGNDRQPLVDRFQNEDEIRVAILSICAAGTGLTLTKAHIVLMAELMFGPDHMFQAEDRSHRIGQDQTVFIRYLMLKGSTDDVLWKMIQNKTRNVGRVLDNRAEFLVAKEIVESTTTDDDDRGNVHKHNNNTSDGSSSSSSSSAAASHHRMTQRTLEESLAAYREKEAETKKRARTMDDYLCEDGCTTTTTGGGEADGRRGDDNDSG